MCQRKHTPFSQVVLLESYIIGLGVSIIREGTETYVTGLDLLNADPERPNIILGYRLPGQSVTINLYGEQLIGFAVIVGEAGIHAIRPIFNENITTSWIGLPEGSKNSKTTELILERDIKAISGKFDVKRGCKSYGTRTTYKNDPEWSFVLSELERIVQDPDPIKPRLPYEADDSLLYSIQPEGEYWLCIPDAIKKEIFKIARGYGLEREPYTSETTRARANIVVTNVRHSTINKVLFVEWKAVRAKTTTPNHWDRPKNQPKNNMRN
ncbi:hypothetical protein PENPOL_c005G06715 [Penicillium polonicum]|uniref:DUF7600 domain-containing protein n=1 Tax=Penicillium polonicum TaxID=60169 RepID=A0A1V6NNT6_PENPO|nr:hypothetical protein PENPOL_c005G06715 [Penicillium polonicum]